MPSFDMSLDTEELSISTDVRERDRIRLERELEKELNGFSFSKTGFHESSDDTVRPGHVDLNQTFFAESPDTKSLNKHFQDFSMGVSASSDGSSIEKGLGLQLGTPNLKKEFSKVYTGSIKSFDRPVVSDRDFETIMKSPLESTTSDYGDVAAKIKQIYSPFDKKTVNVNFGFTHDKDDYELDKRSPEVTNRNKLAHALKKTERRQSNVPIVERDGNIMTPKFVETKSPALLRHHRTSDVNNENIYPIQSKSDKAFWKIGENNASKRGFLDVSKTKAIPRAFKSASGLMQELGLDDNQKNIVTNMPLASEMTQSFQLPDMTGITSLIYDGTQPVVNKIEMITKDKYKNLESIPISSDDKAILVAIRTLQNNINELEARESASKRRIQNLEKELENAKQLYLAEKKRSVTIKQDKEINNSNKNENLHYIRETQECEKLSHTMERIRLKNEVSTLKSQIETLEHELSVNKSKIDTIKEEKNEVLKKLMETLSEVDQLKIENKKLMKKSENIKQKNLEHSSKSSSKKKNVLKKDQLESQSSETNDETSKEYKSDFTVTDNEETDKVSKPSCKTKKSLLLKTAQPSRKSLFASPIKSSKKKNKSDIKKSCKKSKANLENQLEKQKINTSITTDSESSDDTFEYDYSKEYSSDDDILLNKEPAWIQVENKLKTKLDRSKQTYGNKSKQNVRSKSYIDVNAQKIIDGLARHNPTSCSVCTRKRQKEIASRKNNNQLAFSAKTKLDNIYEEENTLRPSMSPQNALSMVIIQLEDEFKHLKLKYQEFIQSYEKIDPAVGKKKRKVLVGRLKSIIEELEAKADQIYALYDVAEITKDEWINNTVNLISEEYIIPSKFYII
ncbi:unnamed protein product [Pneumocystis jirovecii]|uniref:Cep57 centrosome microtubule-binding domain-containing protein n=1 Tax=Pneumocystis jirovecii TaxID=42068 RepID=L0PC92_PNEJI|nr:unnamed protein product [Pneumocystis jirovecii]